MPVKSIAMKRLKRQKRNFYMDEGLGGYQHEYVDFYPAELVEKIITDLSNQVLEERKKWNSLFFRSQLRRRKLWDKRHAAEVERDKYVKALRVLVEHDLIKDCPYKAAVENLVKGYSL